MVDLGDVRLSKEPDRQGQSRLSWELRTDKSSGLDLLICALFPHLRL